MAGGNGFQREQEEKAREAFNKREKEMQERSRGGGNGFQRPKK